LCASGRLRLCSACPDPAAAAAAAAGSSASQAAPCRRRTWPGVAAPPRLRCSSAITTPNAACSPARLSPRLMFGLTGARSGYPLMKLQGGRCRGQRWEPGEPKPQQQVRQRQQYCWQLHPTSMHNLHSTCWGALSMHPPAHSTHGRQAQSARTHAPEAAVCLAHAGIARQLRLGPGLAVPADASIHKTRLQVCRPQLQQQRQQQQRKWGTRSGQGQRGGR
jgi:hypothetical protein